MENLDLNIDLSDLDDLQADLDELHLDDLDFDFRGLENFHVSIPRSMSIFRRFPHSGHRRADPGY
ncbi:MAG: hypothetical protein H6628_00095 [Calditrichae bacterium]|nr:hypothetical protein [Calditrichia bacterium]